MQAYPTLREAVRAYQAAPGRGELDRLVDTVVSSVDSGEEVFLNVRQSAAEIVRTGGFSPEILYASDYRPYMVLYTADAPRMDITPTACTMRMRGVLDYLVKNPGLGGVCFNPWDGKGCFLAREIFTAMMRDGSLAL